MITTDQLRKFSKREILDALDAIYAPEVYVEIFNVLAERRIEKIRKEAERIRAELAQQEGNGNVSVQ